VALGTAGIGLLVALSTPLWASAYVVSTANRIMIAVIALQGLNILTGYTGQISLGQAAFMLVGGYISGLTMIHWGLPIYLTIPLAAIGTGSDWADLWFALAAGQGLLPGHGYPGCPIYYPLDVAPDFPRLFGGYIRPYYRARAGAVWDSFCRSQPIFLHFAGGAHYYHYFYPEYNAHAHGPCLCLRAG
jgi:hypothetical protein